MRNRGMIGVLVAGAMLFSSTAAMAATAPVPAPVTQADPWAVLSVMSGGASAVAVCGASAAPAAARAASGCVLPQGDGAQAAQNPPPEPIPVPPVEASDGGLGISPLLIALVVVAGGIGLYFVLRQHHNNSPA